MKLTGSFHVRVVDPANTGLMEPDMERNRESELNSRQ